MAAILPASSSQYAEVGTRDRNSLDSEGNLRMAVADHVATQAGVDTLEMIKLPPGKIRIHSRLCWLEADAMVATADLHIGHAAYTNAAGATVAADIAKFADNLDAGGGALSQVWPLPVATNARYFDFDTADGLVITVTIDTADMSIGDEIHLECVYSHIM